MFLKVMKIFMSITLFTIFHFIHSIGIQAQTTQTKPDQVQLMKQFMGTWRTEYKNGEAMILEFTPFGPSMLGVRKNFHGDTIIFAGKSVWGYNKKEDKIIQAEIDSSSPDITIEKFWFTSENTFVSQKSVFPLSRDTLSTRFEFKNADLLFITTINNNKDIATYKYNRIEK
jgi:hypothetical protein